MLIGSSVHQEEGLLTEFQWYGWLGYLRNLSYISNFRSFESCQISRRGLLKSLAFRRKAGEKGRKCPVNCIQHPRCMHPPEQLFSVEYILNCAEGHLGRE